MRYLTKSKFLLAMECPTKLFYTGKPEYADRRIEDTFLRELANGGFQVGALARRYFPGGVTIETPNDETAAEVTAEYIAREDNITLFEAAFHFGKLLVRADVVVKTGGRLDIYEVKAKSCDFADEGGMVKRDGMPTADWQKYISDIAFQKYVIAGAYPDLTVRAHLMLADKTTVCSTDGLNQKFQLVREEGRRRIRVSDTLCDADLTPRLLRSINVDATCEKVFASLVGDRRFGDHITFLADSYAHDQKIISPPSKACGKCEFRLADGAEHNGQVSGFRECWTATLNWTAEDFAEPTVLDIWNLRTKDELLAGGKIKFSQLSQDDIKPKPDGKSGISRPQRQWKQVEKVQQGDNEPWIDLPGLREELNGWTYPLHFIDFETSKPAIPFKKDRRPYGGVLFQFSHHTVDENGRIDHAGQFLSTAPGVFPNYDCVRELKRQVGNDRGTIFRYHNHENTFLCEVYDQLLNDPEDIPDRAELCEFIRSITNSTKDENPWTGSRGMVDLYKLVERYHYDPGTNGSVSLKYVLPAALNSSAFLKEKYASPIYGTPEMPSRNFTAQTWVEYSSTGQVSDPYKLLPMLFTDETENDYRLVIEMDKINDGGAAMTAYCKLQFENIPHDIRHGIESALLKYCELDTLAMVMLYESWKALI
jgi:hypothetical protein